MHTSKYSKFYPKSSPYITDLDFVGLFKRLRGKAYNGKPQALIKSFIFWVDQLDLDSLRINKFKNKTSYIQRGNQLYNRILRTNEYPGNYIRAYDRYTMLDLITYHKILLNRHK